jgi:hypothetical protein
MGLKCEDWVCSILMGFAAYRQESSLIWKRDSSVSQSRGEEHEGWVNNFHLDTGRTYE